MLHNKNFKRDEQGQHSSFRSADNPCGKKGKTPRIFYVGCKWRRVQRSKPGGGRKRIRFQPPLPIQHVWYRTDWLTALGSLGLAWGHIRGITHMVATSAFITYSLLPIRASVTFLLFTGTTWYLLVKGKIIPGIKWGSALSPFRFNPG